MGHVPTLTRSQSWFCHSHEEMGRPYSSEPHVPRAQPCSDIPDKPPPPRPGCRLLSAAAGCRSGLFPAAKVQTQHGSPEEAGGGG